MESANLSPPALGSPAGGRTSFPSKEKLSWVLGFGCPPWSLWGLVRGLSPCLTRTNLCIASTDLKSWKLAGLPQFIAMQRSCAFHPRLTTGFPLDAFVNVDRCKCIAPGSALVPEGCTSECLLQGAVWEHVECVISPVPSLSRPLGYVPPSLHI